MADNNQKCLICGTCCIAYSISSLDKKAGVPCKKLLETGSCGDYDNRPQVCRDFKADNLCFFISSLTKDEKIKILQNIYKVSDSK